MELYKIWKYKEGPLVKNFNSGGILRHQEMLGQSRKGVKKGPGLCTPALQSYSI